MPIDSFRPSLTFAQNVNRHCAVLAATMLAAALAGNARADEYLAPIGGPGGGGFHALCPDGQLLIGFDLRAADDVDAMRPVCATAYGFNRVGDVWQGDWHGGTGGRFEAAICPGDRPIVYGLSVGAEGVDTIIVNAFSLECGLAAEIQPPKQDPNRIDAGFHGPSYMPGSATRIWLGYGIGGGGKRATGVYDRQRCPMGQVAVGVHGRSGIWLDAIGLICGAPRVVASIGRINTGEPSKPRPAGWTICDGARDARARNSPAAPNLEAQCRALKTPPAKAPVTVIGKAITTQVDRSAGYSVISAGQAVDPAPPPVVVEPAPAAPVTFRPPLLQDGEQLWACVDAAAGDADAGACTGAESAQAYCQLRGAQSGPDLLIADAQPGTPVRAVNGDACAEETCVVVSELQCDH